MGVRWVLVDEVCGDGEGNDDPRTMYAPMFRDGAIVGSHLFAVDASHLWSIDLATMSRTALLSGLGQPLAVAKRGNELAIAAGREGLVLVDASNPASPARTRSLDLPGAAYDVQVVGDQAWVAMGHHGIARIDLTTSSPTLVDTLTVDGFVAGIAVRDGYVYTAACGTFLVLDASTGEVVAEAWVPSPYSGDRLVAPAKKVTLEGDVAFVAAGRYGAVAIDVSNPSAPVVLGNCTKPEPSFYASGVRAENGKLYVAGGEWGILPLDVSTPTTTCQTLFAATLPDTSDATCSSQPPWEIMPWSTIWAPPPPSKDPIQTLPAGDRVYAFGDARRIGTRAIDVRDTAVSELPLVQRYDEPRALVGIAANASRVVAIGPRGGVFDVDPSGSLTRTATPEVLTTATAVALIEDGRWVAANPTGVFVEGNDTPVVTGEVEALAPRAGSTITLARKSTASSGILETFDVDQPLSPHTKTLFPDEAHLPVALAADANAIFLAAPEWPRAARLGPLPVALDPHGVFDDEDILDVSLWRMRLPRRHLVRSSAGTIEIAGVGPAVGLVVHTESGMKKTKLPAFTYAGAAATATHAYAVAIDRSIYKSYLVSVSLATPSVVSVEAFTGGASGVAVAGGRVFVADGDGFVRTFTIAPDGAAVPAAAFAVGGTP